MKILLTPVPKSPINNIPTLIQIMAWRQSGDKPLSEPMLVDLLMFICITRPQLVNFGNCFTETKFDNDVIQMHYFVTYSVI